MGHIRNHTIVVTANHESDILKSAHFVALSIFPWVSPISPPADNGSQSFFIPPDGSKENWKESIDGDNARNEFKKWLNSRLYDDGGSPLSWVELYFGGDDEEPIITDDSNEVARSNKNLA